MGTRGRLFVVVVVAAIAANFTVGTFNWMLWLAFPPGGNAWFWQDANTWIHFVVNAVLALALWVVAYRLWRRVEGGLP